MSGVSYTLKAGNPGDHIPLRAAATADATRLYWFSGQKLLGRTKPGETLEWRPSHPGKTEIFVSDDFGRNASRTIRVDFVP